MENKGFSLSVRNDASFVQDGDISIERGAQKAGMSLDAFRTAMAEAERSLLLK